MVQNAREESCKAPYTLNKKPWASFLLKSSNPIDPAWKAARLVHNTEGGDRQQVHTAGAPRFRKLNHITLFITHEITGCQYSSHGLPDYCCLRSCQSSLAILPSKFTQSYLQAVVSRVIATRHSCGTETGKQNSFQALSFWHSPCKRQRALLVLSKNWGTNAILHVC